MLFLASRGRAAYLLRKSAILGKTKKKAKVFSADLSILDRPSDYYDEQDLNEQKITSSGYHNTAEMRDAEEEEKE